MAEGRRFHAPLAFVGGRWARDVLLVAGNDGLWQQVREDCPPAERAGAETLPGPALPGMIDGHSHAFQRAIAGLTERGTAGRDDFWSWRDRMYAVALRITPQQLEAIAAFLYTELLAAGYTQVCEFHYLHNDPDGRPYADPLEMSLALVRAARQAGIGLTLLPTLYMRSGFGARGLRPDQCRFASTPDSVLRIAQAVRKSGDARITAGLALHSLRAVDEAALQECATAARAAGLPVHIHVAEQQQEVEDCLRHHRLRPVEWLLRHARPDAHWNLVHATQASASELQEVQRCGASIVLCPSTEANLGDGVFDLPTWLAAAGRWTIGSDSHVTRSWCEELRLLEYSQRLVLRRRNVAARASGQESTAAALLQGALGGASAAAGLPAGGLALGRRADLIVPETETPALAGVTDEHLLDALVFSSPGPRMQRVVVAGRDVGLEPPTARYAQAMRQLRAAG
ncbi:MAG TPA: formimidoylglutamate deiminase [Ramlibacter sp.]